MTFLGVKIDPKTQLQSLAVDAIFLDGCALVSYGFWLAWKPLGFIVAGAALIYVSFSIDKSVEGAQS